MGKYSLLVAAVAIVVTGCAKQPEAVAAIQIDDSAYTKMSCRTLRVKEVQGEALLDSWTAKQKNAATQDFWGVFWIGLPLSSMAGNDPEAQLALAKGTVVAIKSAIAQKGC